VSAAAVADSPSAVDPSVVPSESISAPPSLRPASPDDATSALPSLPLMSEASGAAVSSVVTISGDVSSLPFSFRTLTHLPIRSDCLATTRTGGTPVEGALSPPDWSVMTASGVPETAPGVIAWTK